MDDKSDDSCISMTVSVEEQESIQPTRSIRSTTVSNSKKREKKGVFKKDWTLDKEFSSWLQAVKNDCKQARCKACLRTFSIREGKSALRKHMNSEIHKTHMKTFGNNILITHTSFGEVQTVSAMEGTFVYHGVKHGHSYISQQCTTNLIKDLFASCSNTAKNLACARTKSRAVACNVLAPYFTSKLIDEIIQSRFYSISFDASNKGNIKTYPFAVQYFTDIGVKRGILQFVDDPHESANDIYNNIIKVMENYQLNIRNLTSIGADNANVNFGEHHSVFKLFKDLCPCLVKGNCFAHVLHNGVKHAHDDLLIDVESILCKIYSFFSNSAKRVEELKSYYDFVQVEYRVLLEHITIRWLSLLPSIQRLIENYDPIKNYFLNQQISSRTKPNRTTENLLLFKSFFEDDFGLCILLFLENMLADVQRAELKLQRVSTTAVDLFGIITNLIKKLEQRLNDKYFGNKTQLILNHLKQFDEERSKQLLESFQSFIESFIEYINSYFDNDREFFRRLSAFDCESNDFLKWDYLIDLSNLLQIDGLDRDELYNEYCEIKFMYDAMKNKNVKLNEQIKLYISSKNVYNSKSISNNDRIPCDVNDDDTDVTLNNSASTKANECIRCDQLWSYLLNIKPNSAPNMKLVVAYVFSIPCSNSYVESIFSQMNHLWSNYRNRMDIQLIEAELQIRMNSDIHCSHFYDFLLTQDELLTKIATNEKFVRKKRVDK
ncbi:unnamed protein product [Rotaria sp. Silwood2]|nr:unnamed protein product [Rotaria sp. Silwood2]